MSINEANIALATITLSDIRSAICGHDAIGQSASKCGCARCRQWEARQVLIADLPKVNIDSITLVF